MSFVCSKCNSIDIGIGEEYLNKEIYNAKKVMFDGSIKKFDVVLEEDVKYHCECLECGERFAFLGERRIYYSTQEKINLMMNNGYI